MAGRIDGKVAVITGGGDGIGHAMALRFLAEGGRVVIADLNTATAPRRPCRWRARRGTPTTFASSAPT